MKECLIAVDLAEGSRVVAQAGVTVGEVLHVPAALLHVDEHARDFADIGVGAEDLKRMAVDYAGRARGALLELARGVGFAGTPDVRVRAGKADEAIVEEAKQGEAVCVVLGAHRLGAPGRILGHNVLRVLRHAPCPVLTVNTGRPWTAIGRVLYAADLSEASAAAGRWAAQLAGGSGAELVIVHVPAGPSEAAPSYALPSPLRDARDRSAFEALGRLAAELQAVAAGYSPGAREVRHRLAPPRDEAIAIIDIAREEQPDVIVVGTHGKRGLSRLFLGSVAERVLVRSAAAVFTVPTPR